MRGKKWLVLGLLALALSAGQTPVSAQAGGGAGAVRGRVVGEAGRAVAGARVQLEGNGIRRDAVTESSGRYSIAALPAGEYAVRVEALGFRAAEQRHRIDAGAEVMLDFTLASAPVQLDPLQVVSVTRTSVPLAAIPGAITVVTREQIETQTKITPRIGPMLAQLVPGLGAATENLSNFGQNVRGRALLVLIDGVPQSTSRNVSRDFVNIDPAMVERVEVIRGATSIYGNGATGGVINIITRRGAPGRIRYSTEVSSDVSLSRPGAEGLGPRISQTISGTRGAVDFVASAAASRTGALFDAEGDRIPPDPTGQGGFAETDGYDLFGKIGYTFGPQRLQLTANHFRSRQDTDHASDFSINALPPYQQKSPALPGLELQRGQGTINSLLNLEYRHTALLGSQVRAQAYARDYETVFRPFDDRRYRTVRDTLSDGTARARRAYTGGYVMQTYVNSSKRGGRLEIESPLARRLEASLLWGADYTGETTSQPVEIYDSTAFVRSRGRVFQRTGGAVFVPPLELRTLGLFAQLAVAPVERVLVRAGVRHERASVGLDDFTALNGVEVTGGELRSRPVLFNAGAVVTLTDAVNVFANYTQGFSLADIGLVVRQPRAEFTLGSRDAKPQRVDQYEGGVRGAWGPVQTSVTVFRNESALGTSVGPNLQVVRAPERVRGVEATLDVQPVNRMSLGGTLSWAEGEYAQGDTLWRPLNTFRIQPLKLTGYLEHQTFSRWKNRLQVLRSGSRDRAYDEAVERGANATNPGFGLRPVRSYTVVDLLSELQAGPGTLNIGVRNLLNEQYFPVVSQLMPVGNVSYSAAPGATLSVGYSIQY